MPASSAKVLSASSFCSMVACSQNESFTMPASVGVATPANQPRLVSAFPVKSLAIVDNLARFSAFIKAEENALLEQFFLELIVARRKRPSRARAHEERAAQEYSRYFEQRSDESARDRPAHLRRSRPTQDKNALAF
jgi:hypothetical protein